MTTRAESDAARAATVTAPRTPDVGEQAPDFELPDSTGAPRRLAEMAAERRLVLIFYRGHW